MIQIRKAGPEDEESIWQIIHQVISRGDTYVFSPDSDRSKMLDYWCGSDKHTYVANASYMTAPEAGGKGIGRAIPLWQKLGFEIRGEIPDAFRHAKDGLTDAFVMWRKL